MLHLVWWKWDSHGRQYHNPGTIGMSFCLCVCVCKWDNCIKTVASMVSHFHHTEWIWHWIHLKVSRFLSEGRAGWVPHVMVPVARCQVGCDDSLGGHLWGQVVLVVDSLDWSPVRALWSRLHEAMALTKQLSRNFKVLSKVRQPQSYCLICRVSFQWQSLEHFSAMVSNEKMKIEKHLVLSEYLERLYFLCLNIIVHVKGTLWAYNNTMGTKSNVDVDPLMSAGSGIKSNNAPPSWGCHDWIYNVKSA